MVLVEVIRIKFERERSTHTMNRSQGKNYGHGVVI
jgi:hypothetical protein